MNRNNHSRKCKAVRNLELMAFGRPQRRREQASVENRCSNRDTGHPNATRGQGTDCGATFYYGVVALTGVISESGEHGCVALKSSDIMVGLHRQSTRHSSVRLIF